MDPVRLQTSKNWTTELAQEALGRIKPFSKSFHNVVLCSIIAGIVSVISFVAGSPVIAFSAVVITGVTAAYALFYNSKISRMMQDLRDQGLTRELQSQFGLNVLKKAFNETKNWTEKSCHSFSSKIDNIFEGIVNFELINVETDRDVFTSKKWNIINVRVVEISVDEATKLSLLDLAVNNRVILFFSSLKQITSEGNKEEVNNAVINSFIRKNARDSALLSARFVKNCIETTEKPHLYIKEINRQLKALALKIYNLEEYKTLYPVVQLRKTRNDPQLVVELTANHFAFGAEGNVGDLIEILNLDGITIEIINEGW